VKTRANHFNGHASDAWVITQGSNEYTTVHSAGKGSGKGEGVMQAVNKSKSFKNAVIGATAAVAGLMAVTHAANASLVTLSDGNSIVKLNTNNDVNPDPTNQDGMYNWTVDNVTQLRQQQFWIRTGGSGPATTFGNLVQTSISQTANFLALTYQGTGYTVTADYLLTGGQTGSDVSDIAESVKIINTTSSALTVNLADYIDENLGGSGLNDSVKITGGNTAKQTSNNLWDAETVASPAPSEYEASTYPTLRSGLNSGAALPLNDNSTVSNTDASYAFEWDKTIPAGGSLVIGTDEQITAVPEPTTAVALVGAGGMFMIRPRRRDQDPDGRSVQVAGA